MKRTETLASETFSDEPLKTFTVPIRERVSNKIPFWLKPFKKPIKQETEREFKIYRIRVCNMRRVAGVGYKLPELPDLNTVDTMEKMTGISFPLVHDHLDDIIYLVACCIQNNSKEPEKELVKFISDNFVLEELLDVIITCLNQSGLMSFSLAIQMLRGERTFFVEARDVAPAITQG